MAMHHTSMLDTRPPFVDFAVGPIWRSDSFRQQWHQQVALAANAWLRIERSAVVAGVRSSCLLILKASELPTVSQWATVNDCEMSVLGLEPVSRHGYSVAAVNGPADDGYRVAIHQKGIGSYWHRAWSERDDDAIGEMLGFPKCCREAFANTWAKEGLRDPALSAAQREGSIEGPTSCNTLLKSLGIRAVPHLPCSFACADSQKLGEALLRVGMAVDPGGTYYLERLLGLAMEFSAMHGIGELLTGPMKLSFGTDYTSAFQTYRRDTQHMPSYRDNGFSSEEGMHRAHTFLVGVVAKLLPRYVVDLGCGDGALLSRLRAAVPSIETTLGIEQDHVKVIRGKEHNPKNRLSPGEIKSFTLPPQADLILIAAQRLAEMPTEERERFNSEVLARCQAVIYAYDGGLRRMIDIDPSKVLTDGSTEAYVTEWTDD